jgi:nifR3 family TIM-barrel protein
VLGFLDTMNFWDELKKPFFVMAPMADVTDAAYRKIIAELGKPDVTWTEFVSADGLYHTREIQKIPDAENPLMRDLQFSDIERPIVAQLFSGKPEMMEYAAALCAELGFDGVDINMGCPDTSIEKQGCGAAMIKNPELAKEIVEAARRGVKKGAVNTMLARGEREIPVMVKTRIGYNKEAIDEWIYMLLSLGLPALTIHLRTRKEMSKVPAHWDLVPRIVALRDKVAAQNGDLPKTLIIGNGDVKSVEEARQKAELFGADGVMLGRAIFGNPFVFAHHTEPKHFEQSAQSDQFGEEGSRGRAAEEISLQEKARALATLARSFEQLTPPKSFHIFRKHIKAFITGFDGAAEIRAHLMECTTSQEIEKVLGDLDLL